MDAEIVAGKAMEICLLSLSWLHTATGALWLFTSSNNWLKAKLACFLLMQHLMAKYLTG